MIEKIVYDYLLTKVTPTAIGLELPSPVPAKFILIEKTGSQETNLVKSATVIVQSYDESLYKAADLNETVKSHMKDLVELKTVSSVDIVSDYNFTDPATKRYRYQAVFDITYTETA